MKDIVISDAVKYIGADDKDLDLFERARRHAVTEP